ncbi:hypothetical protein MN608_07546 [Microdochium nivale]|nr:hypothetical protein MN608_07546 [Microdochium nivale]
MIFLNWVDLVSHTDRTDEFEAPSDRQLANRLIQGAKLSPTDDLNLYNAREDQKAAQIAYDTQQDNAFNRFEKDEKRGLTNGLNFNEWIDNGHAPDYVAARDQLTAIGSRIEEIQLKIGGPNSVLVNDARAQLKRGLNTEKAYEG